MSVKRIAYSKEPILKVHRYICVIGGHKKGAWCETFKYCTNLKEVNALKKTLKKGQTLEVHRATHNFIKAYYKF